MTEKCQCIHCHANIEFDLAEFQTSGETATERLGQCLPCPHCGKSTILSVKKKPVEPIHPALGKGALAPCGDCGQPISPHAFMCPHCGRIAGVRFKLVWDVMLNFWLVTFVWMIIGAMFLAALAALGEVLGWWQQLLHR